jgi:ferredoxin
VAVSSRLEVDWILCDGYGICAELFPERIALDPWGYPIINPDIPDDFEAHARRAVAACPKLALSLTKVKLKEKSSPPPRS